MPLFNVGLEELDLNVSFPFFFWSEMDLSSAVFGLFHRPEYR